MNYGTILVMLFLGACSSAPLDENSGSVPPHQESEAVPVEQCTGACLYTYTRSSDPFPERNTVYYACLCACSADICKHITVRANSDSR